MDATVAQAWKQCVSSRLAIDVNLIGEGGVSMNAVVANAARLGFFAGGASLLILGVAIWLGNYGLAGIHRWMGIALVVLLWGVAALAVRAGVGIGPIAFAFAWGAITLVFGLVQRQILAGEWHWTIQVLHVLVSMGVIGVGQNLVARARRPDSIGDVRADDRRLASAIDL
jgi:hypothetical protein